jgi:arginine decarboxylase
MVPGQVINTETIEFMRKLDVKEIHGFNATLGLKLLNLAAMQTLKPASKGAPDVSGNVKRKQAGAAATD